jgi:Tol biopolymer transport system component
VLVAPGGGAPGILGRQGNRDAITFSGAVSADGRRVVFATQSDNLDPDDRDLRQDLYLADASTGTTRVIGRSAGGVPGPVASEFVFDLAISPDGRWVAASMYRDGTYRLRLHDTESGTVRTLAESSTIQGNGFDGLALSHDARHVAFRTSLSLVAEDAGAADIYVWSRTEERFTLASRRSDGGSFGHVTAVGRALTPDGRWLTFGVARNDAIADSTSGLVVRNLESGASERVFAPGGAPLQVDSVSPAASTDARLIAFSTSQPLLPEDANNRPDVYVVDRSTGRFELVSMSTGGAVGDCGSFAPQISGDGSRVVFHSCARNFYPGADGRDEIFLRDRTTAQTLLMTRPLDGQLPSGHFAERDPWPHWSRASISADGQVVAFASTAEELVKGDSNRRADVFRVALPGREIERVGLALGAPVAAGASRGPLVTEAQPRAFASIGGDVVAFNAQADNLLLSRTPGALRWDVRQGSILDALELLVEPPPRSIEVVDGVSDDGGTVLVRRSLSPVDFGGLPPPPPPVPYDLWLQDRFGWYRRIDVDPMLGANHAVRLSVLSGDARRVAFVSQRMEPPWTSGIYVTNAFGTGTRRVDVLPSGADPAVGTSSAIGISRNGRWLVFSSLADGLVAGDADGSVDLFLADLVGGGLLRLLDPASGQSLLDPDGYAAAAVAVSDDGQRVVYASDRDPLLPGGSGPFRILLLDRGLGLLREIGPASTDGWWTHSPSISADGRRVAFLHGRTLRVLELDASGATVGEPTLALPPIKASHAAISTDGHAVAIMSNERFDHVPGWLAGDVTMPLLLRLPEPRLFGDDFEP